MRDIQVDCIKRDGEKTKDTITLRHIDFQAHTHRHTNTLLVRAAAKATNAAARCPCRA